MQTDLLWPLYVMYNHLFLPLAYFPLLKTCSFAAFQYSIASIQLKESLLTNHVVKKVRLLEERLY